MTKFLLATEEGNTALYLAAKGEDLAILQRL
jgi:hypothetical protein